MGLMRWQATDLGEPAVILGALEKRRTKRMKEARQQMFREEPSGSIMAMKGRRGQDIRCYRSL